MEFNERYLNGELQVLFDQLNFEISYREIYKACKELSINKTGGPDFVLNEFFKYGINEMVFCLCKLFNSKAVVLALLTFCLLLLP